MIYHTLHKKLSKEGELTDNEIRKILRETIETVLPGVQVYGDEKYIYIKKGKKTFRLPIQKWIDSIQMLWDNYYDYMDEPFI